jgi:L-asparaginase II
MVYLVQKLYRRTDDGDVEWEETEIEGVFQAAFPEYTIRLSMETPDGHVRASEDYVLTIFNSRGLKIEEVADVDLAEDLVESYEVMKHLYGAARRKAMGVEQALDSLLSALGPEDISS